MASFSHALDGVRWWFWLLLLAFSMRISYQVYIFPYACGSRACLFIRVLWGGKRNERLIALQLGMPLFVGFISDDFGQIQ